MLNRSNQLVLQGCVEVLSQARQLLECVSDDQYQERLNSGRKSSIGEHFRHILDMFEAVKLGIQVGKIDYDRRERGGAVETDRDVCASRCEQMQHYFSRLDDESLAKNAQVKTEVTLYECHSIELNSSICREIIFVSTHAVHHFAIVNDIARQLHCNVANDFGLAPATKTFIRTQR